MPELDHPLIESFVAARHQQESRQRRKIPRHRLSERLALRGQVDPRAALPAAAPAPRGSPPASARASAPSRGRRRTAGHPPCGAHRSYARADLPCQHSTGRARSPGPARRTAARRAIISGNSVTTSMCTVAISVRPRGQSTRISPAVQIHLAQMLRASREPSTRARALHHHHRPPGVSTKCSTTPELHAFQVAHLQTHQVGLVVLALPGRRQLAPASPRSSRPSTGAPRRDPRRPRAARPARRPAA